MRRKYSQERQVPKNGSGNENCARVLGDCVAHRNQCFRVECDSMSQAEASRVYGAVKIMSRVECEVTGGPQVGYLGQ
jgi:hypothetical protein